MHAVSRKSMGSEVWCHEGEGEIEQQLHSDVKLSQSLLSFYLRCVSDQNPGSNKSQHELRSVEQVVRRRRNDE